jgi:hypothetical protein
VKSGSVTLDQPANILSTPPTECPFFSIGAQVDPLNREELGIGQTGIIDHWRVLVEIVLDAPTSDNAAKITACQNLSADIEKAVAAASWTRAGGTAGAQWVTVQQPRSWLGVTGNRRCFIEQPIDIKFHRTRGTA